MICVADEADEAGYARERPRRRELKLLAATIAQSQWPRRASTRMKASKHLPGQREREREIRGRRTMDGWMDIRGTRSRMLMKTPKENYL